MRYLMIAVLSFCIGAAVTLPSLPGTLLLILSGALLCAAIAIGVLFRKSEIRLTLILGFCACGILFGVAYRMQVVTPALQFVGQTDTFVCEATDYSRTSTHGVTVEARLLTSEKPVRFSVSVYSDVTICPGDQFTAELTLSDSAADGSYYSYADGVYLYGSTSELSELAPCARTPLRYLPRAIAHRLEESLEQRFPEDMLGFAEALTTGNRSLMTSTDKALLQRAGIYHALALSGMHMSILAGCLVLLRRRKRLQALLGIPLCIAFAVVTGAGASVVRAAVIQCLLLLSAAVRREADTPTSLSAAAFLLVVQNPWSIMSWGAQLSFASVVGLYLFGQRMYQRLCGRKTVKNSRARNNSTAGVLMKKLSRRIRTGFAASVSATLSAMSLTVPLMAVNFGYISLISPVTNLLCGGIVGLCFIGSLLTALLGLFLRPAALTAGTLTAWGFRYIRLVSGFLSRLPFSCLYTDRLYGIIWLVLLYAMLVLLMHFPKMSRKIPVCAIASGLCLCILLTLLEGTASSVTAIDVGQGQCLLLQNRGGTVMIDCGNTGETAGKLAADYLTSRGIPDVDLLILTHYDADHADGVIPLMNLSNIRAIALPDTDSALRADIESEATRRGISIYVIRQDTSVYFGGQQLTIYAPVSDEDSNDSCLSVLSEKEDLSVLVTGDMDADTELQLLASHALPDLDILIAGHHGAKTSTSEELLEAASPEYVIISVGENHYGHPAEETLERIHACGAVIYRTDQMGNITIRAGRSEKQ